MKEKLLAFVRTYGPHFFMAFILSCVVSVAIHPVAGIVMVSLLFVFKDAGEFALRHQDVPNRPWEDFNLFSKHRTNDERLDVAFSVAGAITGAIIVSLLYQAP
ncbi:MAG: hypothetical protein QW318_07160 [Candidatus Caldarchaeum sp.]